jgi:hypothetical protein
MISRTTATATAIAAAGVATAIVTAAHIAAAMLLQLLQLAAAQSALMQRAARCVNIMQHKFRLPTQPRTACATNRPKTTTAIR